MKTEFNFESIPFSAKYDGTRIIDGWEDAGATSRDLREMFSPYEIEAMEKALEDY